MNILTEKEKDTLGDISDVMEYTDNMLVVEFEKLRKNVNNFYKLFSKYETLYLSLTEEEIKHKKLQLEEILRDINAVNKRIQNNIFVIKKQIKNDTVFLEKNSKFINSSLGDMLTNYEIAIAKFQAFYKKHKYKIKFTTNFYSIYE